MASEDKLLSGFFNKLQDIGRAEELLAQFLMEDMFRDLSKHNTYWDSEHEPEDDKLHDCRMKLHQVQNKISEALELMRRDDYGC